nr:triacylglycerol lipase 2-like [Ipomoea batatas]
MLQHLISPLDWNAVHFPPTFLTLHTLTANEGLLPPEPASGRNFRRTLLEDECYSYGPNCCVNSSRTVILLEHEPQSTATNNLIHIAQMVREGSITMYDYGSENENNKHYGQSSPSAYAMANILDDIPLFLSYGGQDYLSDVNDVKILLDQLHNHNGDKLLVKFIEDYAHADFVFGVNAKQLVYDCY